MGQVHHVARHINGPDSSYDTIDTYHIFSKQQYFIYLNILSTKQNFIFIYGIKNSNQLLEFDLIRL